MLLMKPAYYDSFCCLASRCPDTCCQEWDIQIDPETAGFYQQLPGALGDRIRASIRMEDGEPVIALKDGQCPMHRPDGLCGIQAELGENALCQVCRDFPRLHHDYGSFLELGLEMSCPEAARLLLTEPDFSMTAQQLPGGSEPEYDREAMEVLLSTRTRAMALLEDCSRPLEDTLILLFFYGCHAQALLDGEEPEPFDPDAALETGRAMGKASDFQELVDFFSGEEVLTEQWHSLLQQAQRPVLSPMVRNLAGYFVMRYWLQAVSDYDLYCRVKFVIISCLLVSSLPGDFIWNAHLFSKEIENDIENVDDLLDAAYENPVFTDDRLLGFLQQSSENPML